MRPHSENSSHHRGALHRNPDRACAWSVALPLIFVVALSSLLIAPQARAATDAGALQQQFERERELSRPLPERVLPVAPAPAEPVIDVPDDADVSLLPHPALDAPGGCTLPH